VIVILIASKRRSGPVQKVRKIRALPLLVWLTAVLVVGPPRTRAADQSASPENGEISSNRKTHRRKPAAAPTPLALPADVKVPSYTPGFFPFHDGERLVYEASWLGIPAARGWFELHRNRKDPSLWNIEAWIETNKVVDLVFRMRDYMRERVAVDSLKAQDIYQVQHENQRANEYTITFDDKNNLVVSTKKNPTGTETHEFISRDPFGPISGAMMALSQDLAPGRRYLFDVFSGTNRYVFDFNVQGRERVVVPVGSYDALKVSPGIVYLSNGKLRTQARETTVWISADKRHLPLRMEAATFIGTVRADLVQIDGPPPVKEE
jgi:hypothetical protein